jgi:hypothetical protein
MAFNPDVKKKIVQDKKGEYFPCLMCGTKFPLPDAAHIIDEKNGRAEKSQAVIDKSMAYHFVQIVTGFLMMYYVHVCMQL